MTIIISLVFVIGCLISYAIGNRNGISEGREEMIKRFTKTTARQMMKLAFGEVFGRN